MILTFSAVVEQGKLRPVTDVSLPEGSEVLVSVTTTERPRRTPAEILAEIAAMPDQGMPADNVSEEHDRYLYGEAPRK